MWILLSFLDFGLFIFYIFLFHNHSNIYTWFQVAWYPKPPSPCTINIFIINHNALIDIKYPYLTPANAPSSWSPCRLSVTHCSSTSPPSSSKSKGIFVHKNWDWLALLLLTSFLLIIWYVITGIESYYI